MFDVFYAATASAFALADLVCQSSSITLQTVAAFTISGGALWQCDLQARWLGMNSAALVSNVQMAASYFTAANAGGYGCAAVWSDCDVDSSVFTVAFTSNWGPPASPNALAMVRSNVRNSTFQGGSVSATPGEPFSTAAVQGTSAGSFAVTFDASSVTDVSGLVGAPGGVRVGITASTFAWGAGTGGVTLSNAVASQSAFTGPGFGPGLTVVGTLAMSNCTVGGADTLLTFAPSAAPGAASVRDCALLSALAPAAGDPPPYVVDNQSPWNVNLQNNYWGDAFTAAPEQLPRFIRDVFDDVALGEVAYLPMAASAPPAASSVR